jgi:PhnB protein
MSRIQSSPYVNFQGKAREAMGFYHEVLGGTLDLRAMRLDADGAVILATDGHPDYPATVGDNMAIALSGSDRDRLTGIFHGLAAGGIVQMPLARQAWGGEVGWLKDRFGIAWTVSIDGAEQPTNGSE